MEGKIGSSSGKEVSAEFSVRELSLPEKRTNAMKALGIFWGLSLVTIPLPPIHWITVPGFFLFGIYWAIRKLREGEYLEPFRFPCPECGNEVKVQEQEARNPLAFVCPSCRYHLRLEWPASR